MGTVLLLPQPTPNQRGSKRTVPMLLDIGQDALAGGAAVQYTRDAGEAVQAVDEGRCRASFLMNPTGIAEVTTVAENGEKMPQKSTFFYPKLITGLVINKF